MSPTRLSQLAEAADADAEGGDQSIPRQFQEALAEIAGALRGMRYGTVTAVVQDGVVVQVDRTERVRLTNRTR